MEKKCELKVKAAKEASVIASSESSVERDFPVASSVIGQSASQPVINILSLESTAERTVEAATKISCLQMKTKAQYKQSAFV